MFVFYTGPGGKIRGDICKLRPANWFLLVCSLRRRITGKSFLNFGRFGALFRTIFLFSRNLKQRVMPKGKLEKYVFPNVCHVFEMVFR